MITSIPRGTVIEALGLQRTVARSLFVDINIGYADIEFQDENGQYGHYKSGYDKGRIIFPDGVIFDYRKENVNE